MESTSNSVQTKTRKETIDSYRSTPRMKKKIISMGPINKVNYLYCELYFNFFFIFLKKSLKLATNFKLI